MAIEIWRMHGERVGDFVGFGTLVGPPIVALHPAAVRALVGPDDPEALQGVRLRCVTGGPGGSRAAVDGEVVLAQETAGEDSPTAVLHRLIAVKFEGMVRGEETPLPLSDGDPDYVAIAEFLHERAALDPPGPAGPPPLDSYLPWPAEPRGKPPWCAVWPNCWGC